jgi:hypothetical protein
MQKHNIIFKYRGRRRKCLCTTDKYDFLVHPDDGSGRFETCKGSMFLKYIIVNVWQLCAFVG